MVRVWCGGGAVSAAAKWAAGGGRWRGGAGWGVGVAVADLVCLHGGPCPCERKKSSP